jgi:hypothetical protein
MRANPSGRLLGALPPDKASSVALSKSVISKRVGNGTLKASAMEPMILREGLAFPLVKSDRNDMDIPAFSARSCFVIPCSSSRRKTFVKNIWLYTVGYALRSAAQNFSR